MSEFDVVIIGAGINGAGVAQAAAAQGYRVLVLEKNQQPGLETSSASSKLIHGGLRYLEGLQIPLVYESLQERELLLKIAPELVRLQTFNIPIYKNTKRNQLTLHAGLSMYAILSGFRRHSFYRQAAFQDWDKLEDLKLDGLKTVFQYQDAQTDDRALTRAVMTSAQHLGALLETEACFVAAKRAKGALEICYRQQGVEKTAITRTLVNAAGPWVYPLDQQIENLPASEPPELVQGAHLVLDKPLRQAFYLEAPQDQRAVFLLPWKGGSLLGTTETAIPPDFSKICPTDQEREYLMTVFHHFFPYDHEVKIRDEMAGLRVLARQPGQLNRFSREVVIQPDSRQKPRVISIIGGKLTVYRRTAIKVMKQLQPSLPISRHGKNTARLPLHPVD